MATPMQFCMETNSDWLKAIIPEEGRNGNSSSSSASGELMPCPLRLQAPNMLERRLRPPHDQALKCPRCDSTHTKFCYYNNYSLSQPRYFCKTCRRYWTKGGTLRNVPVGGGCRKNKRPSSSKKNPVTDQIPSMIHHHHHDQHQLTDLNISNLNFMFDSANNHFGSGFGIGLEEQGNLLGFSIDDACQRLVLPFGGQEEENAVDVKPGNRMLSLEWPDQGSGDTFGYSNGLALWAGMINGHGPSSAAM